MQILDGVLIANELIDSRRLSKQVGVIFKIEMENAYDHVDWDSVDYMLRRFSLGEGGMLGFGNVFPQFLFQCWLTILPLASSKRLEVCSLLWWEL